MYYHTRHGWEWQKKFGFHYFVLLCLLNILVFCSIEGRGMFNLNHTTTLVCFPYFHSSHSMPGMTQFHVYCAFALLNILFFCLLWYIFSLFYIDICSLLHIFMSVFYIFWLYFLAAITYFSIFLNSIVVLFLFALSAFILCMRFLLFSTLVRRVTRVEPSLCYAPMATSQSVFVHVAKDRKLSCRESVLNVVIFSFKRVLPE